MLTKGQQASRASMLQALIRASKLTDEFLPPKEFMIVKSTPYPKWPQYLKDKLSNWTGDLDKKEVEKEWKRLWKAAEIGENTMKTKSNGSMKVTFAGDKLTIHLTVDFIRALKARAAEKRDDIGEIIEGMIRSYMEGTYDMKGKSSWAAQDKSLADKEIKAKGFRRKEGKS